MTPSSNTNRRCGSCTACCTVLAVGAIGKPANTRCPHLRVGAPGCGCYDGRPAECRTYICGWMQGMGGVADRPDRSGVIFDRQRAIDDGDVIVVAREVRVGALEGRARKLTDELLRGDGVVVFATLDGQRRMRGPQARVLRLIELAKERGARLPR